MPTSIAWSRRWNMGFNLPGPAQTGALDSLELVRRLAAKGADVNARQTKEPTDGNRNKLDRIGATPFVLASNLPAAYRRWRSADRSGE